MSLKDVKRKIAYWDGVNITYLPNVSFVARDGRLLYKSKVFKGKPEELISLVEKEYRLVTFDSLGIDIIEVKSRCFIVKVLGKYRIIEAGSLITFMLNYLIFYTRGISLESLSSKYRLREVLSMSLQEFINFPLKEELLLKLSPNFVSYAGLVYPSLEYLQDYLELQDSEIFKLCCNKEIQGEGLYKRSAHYGSKELLSVKRIQSKLVLNFSDGTALYIAPDLFELFMRNAVPFKPSYDLGNGELGIRDISTLYNDFYLNNFTLSKHITKTRGSIYVTKKYESSISNYISYFKVTGDENVLPRLSLYCYYQGLSTLYKLGIKEAKTKLVALEGYSLFKSLGERFKEHVRKFSGLSYSVSPTVNLEKKQVRFLGKSLITNTPLDSYLKEIENFLKDNQEFLTVIRFLGFTIPSKDVFISLYKKLQSDKVIYKDHLGREFVRFTDMANAWGISPFALKHRIDRGWDIERALTQPVSKILSFFGNEFKDHLGNQYKSFNAMCKAYNLNPATVKTRLKGGMPLEEALTKRPRK
jgi:hypothetical protein